jgi:hypothetical protein
MAEPRVPLYERLPEIYRIRDAEQAPPDQLRHYLTLVEAVFEEIHKNIDALYHDLFIETCDEWVIPYIGDLLGVSHLSGEAWTLRADVADTIALRRRKGTLASIERLTYNLTRWGVHCVELFEKMVWNQHLNHQRPDHGGIPPYSLPTITRFNPIRGGTVTLRDPALLSLLNTPFDPFAHVADVKPPARGNIRYNLPNLAIFLWRIKDYRVPMSPPKFLDDVIEVSGPGEGEASHLVGLHVHPLGEPVRLFNTYQFDPDRQPPVVTDLDRTPNAIPMARLTQDSPAGRPECYVAIDTYDPVNVLSDPPKLADVGLQLHLSATDFDDEHWPDDDMENWRIRGGNLCDWENSIRRPVLDREVVVDPVVGRILIGVGTNDEALAIENDLMVTYTYGAPGPVGAHPIDRFPTPEPWSGEGVDLRPVNLWDDSALGLNGAFSGLHEAENPVLIQIEDSSIHELNLADIAEGIEDESGDLSIVLNKSLLIRSVNGQRPIIRLSQPLRFRPADPAAADDLVVRLEGLYLTSDSDSDPLIARAALNRLEIINCTLDPRIQVDEADGTRTATPSMALHEPYGFEDPAEEIAFDQTPEIVIQRSITGPLRIDTGYRLSLVGTIIDSARGVSDPVGSEVESLALTAASEDPTDGWGPPTHVEGITVFGRMRVERIHGRGGIWVHALEVLNHQVGCIKFSYFSGHGDQLPQSHGCVSGTDARLHFTSEIFGEPAYGQLAFTSDFRIRERGPGDDAMGAFGFLKEAHKWRNLQIRFREFMPVGIRPLLIPVT